MAGPGFQNVEPTFVIFSKRGTPHKVADDWLKSFPLDMMQAVRRAIAFTLQLRLYRGVDQGLNREW